MHTIKIFAALIFTAFQVGIVRAETKPEIDLIGGTVNGQAMVALTPDKITDLFGRPSATTDPRILPGLKSGATVIPETEVPSTIVYGDLGLIFRFRHPRSDPKQTIASILVFLSQQSDENTHTQMKPFSGTLSRAVNGNWKAKRVMEEFTQFNPIDEYDAKRAQDLRTLNEKAKAIGMDRTDSTKTSISSMTTIRLKTPKTFVYFKYEEQTKFLERLEIGPERNAKK